MQLLAFARQTHVLHRHVVRIVNVARTMIRLFAVAYLNISEVLPHVDQNA